VRCLRKFVEGLTDMYVQIQPDSRTSAREKTRNLNTSHPQGDSQCATSRYIAFESDFEISAISMGCRTAWKILSCAMAKIVSA